MQVYTLAAAIADFFGCRSINLRFSIWRVDFSGVGFFSFCRKMSSASDGGQRWGPAMGASDASERYLDNIFISRTRSALD